MRSTTRTSAGLPNVRRRTHGRFKYSHIRCGEDIKSQSILYDNFYRKLFASIRVVHSPKSEFYTSGPSPDEIPFAIAGRLIATSLIHW